jgi:hypothetical protein
MVFDGEELLKFAVKAIRQEVDHISVTYQNTSYFGNQNESNLEELLDQLKNQGLIDQAILYQPDLTLSPKENELKLRNLGIEISKKAGCTHHISSDVDEFYMQDQLKFAKKEIEKDDYDFSIVPILYYYKNPQYLIWPPQDLVVSFIHPIDNEYNKEILYPEFPFHMEITRRLKNKKKYRIFTRKEIEMHHMSYVRKDIRKKFANSDNSRFYQLKRFYNIYDNYKLGDNVYLLPDYLNRKTILVDNIFGISI